MISVVINTYNASRFLREVLNSVKTFDEIVICDMESTDNTLDIAREYGCKIVTFPKENHVSAEPARTFAIQSATHPWVLVIDADEIVTPELHDYLYDFISKHEDALDSRNADAITGLWIPRKNYFMGRFMHCHYPDYLLRFFIKDGTTWPPHVHTFPTVRGRQERIPRQRMDMALIHLANDGVKDIVRKTNQYTENEIYKKAGKHYGWGALLWRPFFRFFKAYILKGGWRDGKEGFIRARLEGEYQLVMLGKFIEETKKK